MTSALNRLLRPTMVGVLGIAAAATSASANVEVGGTAGAHIFNHVNELGVPDVEGAPSERNTALLGLRLGVYFNDMLGVEGEFGVLPGEARGFTISLWNITYRAHVIAQFRADDPDASLIPFVLAGGGAMQVVQSDNQGIIAKDTDAELYIGAGIKYRVDNGWGLRADVRLLFPPASVDGDNKPTNGFTEDFEVLFSIYKEFGRVKKAPVDDDPDHDGIKGAADKCPNDPEDKDGFQDADGCPDLDNDGDGVPDAQDKCPMEPEDKDGFQDADGCPDPDNDGDGIPDAQDKCPNEPEDKDGFQDADGCPDPDNDADGIPDAQDKCPNEPETKNGYQDADGCPDEIPAQMKKFSGVIQGINFKTGDATILATSNKTLDEAAKVLVEFKDVKLEIQGHTDDEPIRKGGKYDSNEALSQARAESVKAYLVKKGIEDGRLEAKGYGPTQPQVDPTGLKGKALNDARAKNRRVEFKLGGSGNVQVNPAPPAGGDKAPAPTPPPAPAPKQ